MSRARSKTLDGVALRVRLQPLLPVRGADLAVGLAPPSQVVEGLEQVVYCGRDRQLKLQVGGARRCRPHPRLRRLGVVLQADLEQEGVVSYKNYRYSVQGTLVTSGMLSSNSCL